MSTAWSQGRELMSIGKCLAARCVPEHLFVHFSCTANNQALAACLSAVMGQDLQQVEDHGVAKANLGLRCANVRRRRPNFCMKGGPAHGTTTSVAMAIL